MSIVLIILVFFLKFLLYFFLTLLTLVLLLLILPFTYNVYLNLEDEFTARLKIGWAFGLLSIEMNIGIGDENYLRVFGIKVLKLKLNSKEEKIKQDKEEKGEKVEDDEKKSNIFTFGYIIELIEMGIIEDLFAYLVKLLRIILPRKIELLVHYGLSDPSLTGQMHGAYSSLPILRDRWNIYMYPNFVDEDFQIEGYIIGKFHVIFSIILIIKVMLNKTIRKILRDMRRNKKNGKQKQS